MSTTRKDATIYHPEHCSLCYMEMEGLRWFRLVVVFGVSRLRCGKP